MDKLNNIVEGGKFYMYRGDNIKITDSKKVDNCYKLIYETSTQKDKLKVIKEDDIEEFISELLEVDDSILPVQIQAESAEIFKHLSNGLMDDFNKLQTEREYIGQAKQRSNIVNTMINTLKLQIELSKKQ